MRWALGTEDAHRPRSSPARCCCSRTSASTPRRRRTTPRFAKALAASATSTSTTRSAPPTARTPRPWASRSSCRPYAGLLMEKEIDNLVQAAREPGAAVRGDHRRRQGVAARSPCSRTCWTRSTPSSSAAAWPTPSSSRRACSVGKSLLETRPRRGRQAHPRDGRGQAASPSSCRRTSWSPRRSPAARSTRSCPRTRSPTAGRRWTSGPPRIEGRSRRPWSRRRTVVWNGPLGVFEVPTFGDGTRAMARLPVPSAPRKARPSSSVAATRSRPSRSSSSPTRSPMSRPAAARASSSSRARSCRDLDPPGSGRQAAA